MATATKKKLKYAGMVAPPIAAKREKLDLHIRVKPDQLARLGQTANEVMAAAETVKAAAAEVVSAFRAPQQRLNRRVQISIQDSDGAQMSAAVYDLKESDVLEAFISGEEIKALISNGEAR